MMTCDSEKCPITVSKMVGSKQEQVWKGHFESSKSEEVPMVKIESYHFKS